MTFHHISFHFMTFHDIFADIQKHVDTCRWRNRTTGETLWRDWFGLVPSWATSILLVIQSSNLESRPSIISECQAKRLPPLTWGGLPGYNTDIKLVDSFGICHMMWMTKKYAAFKMQACWISWRAAAEAFLLEPETYLRNSLCHLCSVFSWELRACTAT